MIDWIFRGHRHLRDDQLSTYLDGMLNAAERQRVDAHLERCDRDCPQRLAELRTTVRMLRSVATARVPRSFALRPDQVAAPAKPRLSRPVRQPGFFAPAVGATVAAAAFAFFVLAGLTGVISQSGVVQQQPQAAVSGASHPMIASTSTEPSVQATSELRTDASINSLAPSAAGTTAPSPAASTTTAGSAAGFMAVAPKNNASSTGSQAVSGSNAPVAPTASVYANAQKPEALVQQPPNTNGIRLPVWQLEAASGGIALLLAGLAFAAYRRFHGV